MVCREAYTEGSGTTNSGTDEQKLYMRLSEPDKQAHHCDVPTSKDECSLSRYSRNWRKDSVLTWGDLPDHELDQEKSAEVIVPNRK